MPEDIYNLLNPIALAHWIQGDGKVSKTGGLLLCTDSYSTQDFVRLMNVLILRCGLECTLHSSSEGKYRIYILKRSMDKLRAIVLPYFVTNMLYKLHINNTPFLQGILTLDLKNNIIKKQK